MMRLPFHFWVRQVAPLAFASAVAGRAATVTWSPPSGSPPAAAWSDPGNWDLGRAPVAGDDVLIPAGPTAASFSGPDVTLNSLSVSGACQLAGGTITVSNRVQAPGGSLRFTGGSIAGGATVRNGALSFGPGAAAGGDFILQGGSTLAGNVPQGASVWIRGSSQDQQANALWTGGGTNFGTVRLESIDGGWPSQLSTDVGRVVNEAGGALVFSQGAGGYRALNAPLVNRGRVEASTNVLAEIRPPAGTNQAQLAGGEVIAGAGSEIHILAAALAWTGGTVAGRVGSAGGSIQAIVAPGAGGGRLYAWGQNTFTGVGSTNVTLQVEGNGTFQHALLSSASNATVDGLIVFQSADGPWASALNAASNVVVGPAGALVASLGAGGNRDFNGAIVNAGRIHIDDGVSTSFRGSYTGNGGVTEGPFHVVDAAVRFQAPPAAPTELMIQGVNGTLSSDIPSGQSLWIRGDGAFGHAALAATVGIQNHGVVRLESVDGGWTETLTVAGAPLTNAPGGRIVANQGAGGPRVLAGSVFNQGSIGVSNGAVFSVTGAGSVLQQAGGRIAADAASRLVFFGARFDFTGGALAGRVLSVNATNHVGPDAILPSTLEIHGVNSVLEANESPSATLWVHGTSLYGHAILNVPVTAENRGVVHLESSDGGWACDLRSAAGASFVNWGTVSSTAGAAGERRFDGTFLNRGVVSVDPSYGMQFYGAFENAGGAVSGPAALVNIALSVTAPAAAASPASLLLVGTGGTLSTPNLPNTALHVNGNGNWGHAQLALPAGFVNLGELDMETRDGGWTVTLSSTAGSIVTNGPGGLLSVPFGAGGPRVITAPLVNQGQFALNTGLQIPALTNAPGGAVAAQGTLQLSAGPFWNAGALGFGPAIGALRVAGDFAQAAPGSVSFKADRPAGGPVNDALQVDGQARLGGSAAVVAPGGFSPASGDAFDLVVAGTRRGQFPSLNLPTLPNSTFLSPAYTDSRLRLTVGSGAGGVTAPFITGQPGNARGTNGAPATLSVTASGGAPLSYQWFLGGKQLDGATNTLLAVTIGPATAGAYTVQVSNGAGSVLSDPASVIVLDAYVPGLAAATTNLPGAGGDGVNIDLFNGIGGGVPGDALLAGLTPTGSLVSPVLDFPHPGQTVNLGDGFAAFFGDTTTLPAGLRNLPEGNFVLRNRFYLRVSRDLDLDPSTPAIDVALGVGSDDGFSLTVGGQFVGSAGDRGFSYSWFQTAFEAEGLYPVELLYDDNAVGPLGLEFSWQVAGDAGPVIVPQSALYTTPAAGDRGITFEELPEGAAITNQFANLGVLMNATPGVQITGAKPASFIPVSPTHVYGDPSTNAAAGSIDLNFVAPGAGAVGVVDLVRFYLINAAGPGASVTAQDPNGTTLFSHTYSAGVGSREAVLIQAANIARVHIDLGAGTNAAAIDNLAFSAPILFVPPPPDLVVASINAPASAAAGDTVVLSWVDRNVGAGGFSNAWVDHVYLVAPVSGAVAVDFGFAAPPAGSAPLAPGALATNSLTVTFPAAGSGIPFGSYSVRIVADSTHTSAESNFTNNLLDSAPFPYHDRTHLSLALSPASVPGGRPVQGSVTRDGGTGPLVVQLSSSDPAHASTPPQATIPDGATSATFTVGTTDDGLIRPPLAVTITASAPESYGASSNLVVLGRTPPSFTFTVTPPVVSEAAGPAAAQGAISAPAALSQPLTFALGADHPAAVTLPALVTLPAHQQTVTFPIGAVDDPIVQPDRMVEITASLVAGGQTLAVLGSESLTLTEAEVPTLFLTLSHTAAPEGASTTATVRRNTGTNGDLSVNLLTDTPAKVVPPASVTITNGSDHADFTVSTVNDGLNTGDITVALVASADGFVPSTNLLTVTDINLPDLVVTAVSGPTRVETGQQINASWTIANQGVTAANGPFLVRLYLVSGPDDPSPVQVNEYQFADSLPPGGALTLSPAFFVPNAIADYRLEAVVDPTGLVPELRKDNNSALSAATLHVAPAYMAEVRAGVSNAPAGTPVTLSGRAYATSGGDPAPYVVVSIHVVMNQFDRTIAALTDGNGNFSTVFQPLPTEGGYYTVSAGFPGQSAASLPAQGAFTLIGMRANPASAALTPSEGAAVTGSIEVDNLSAVPLTGLGVSVVSDPAAFAPSLSLSAATLPGSGRVFLNYQFAAGPPRPQTEPLVLRVTSSEGATTDVTLDVAVIANRPVLSANPAALTAGMLRGVARTVSFGVTNSGSLESGPLTVALPPAPWLALGSTNVIPSIPAGGAALVTLVLTPALDLPLGDYTGGIILSGPAASITEPFHFRALSDAKGGLAVTVVDELTYYAAGAPKVTNAAVTVLDAYTRRAVTNGVTDASGAFFAGGLPEGYYELDVTADKHSSYQATVFVEAGADNPNEVFLAREAVQFIWTVTPTTIQDRTQITIETVFETVVPIPVVTMEPTVIDLADIRSNVTFMNLTVTNHGLLAAKDTRLSFPTHPLWRFTPLIENLGDLPANSALVIPLKIEWLGAGAPGSQRADPAAAGGPRLAGNTGGPCSLGAQILWSLLCGPRTNTYSSGSAIINAAHGCTGGGGFAGFFGGAAGAAGAAYNLSLPIFKRPDVCSCDYFPKICISGEAQVKFDGIADALASALLKLLPNFSVFKKDVSLSVSGKLCTCCVSNQVSYTADGTGSAQIKIVLRGGLTPSGKFKADVGNWKDVGINGDFLLGAEATIEASVKVSLMKECLKDPKTCVTGTASLKVFGGTKGSAGVSATDTVTGLSFSGSGSFNLGAQGVGSATIQWCAGEGGKISVCGKVEVIANVNADLKARDPRTGLDVSKSFSANADDIVAQAGDCAPAGKRLLPAPKGIDDVILGPDDFIVPENQLLASLGVANAHPGVCAQVRLKLDQDAILTRNAFKATLEVSDTDSAPLENFRVEVHAKTADGADADALFGIEPPVLNGLSAVDGSGAVPTGTRGTASWILIPTLDAAPAAPTQFLVGGVVHYLQNGIQVDQPLADAPITVYPSPELTVQYFHQRDVFADDPFTPQIEPSLPFDLAVFVQNRGNGTAHDFKIASSQPQIVDNEKGLLISFKIIGTEVDGRNLTPSLTADFGDIGPGSNSVGTWLLTSSLQGLFLDYSATFKHVDDLGKPRLSLIDAVSIHEMVHLVEAGGIFADGKPDFLVHEDTNDLHHLPNKLYLSDGTTNDVAAVLTASIDGPPSAAKPRVMVTASMPAGWGYLQIPEPSDGSMRLTRVTRSDGVELPIDKLFWTTDRTFIGMGQRPIYENLLHLLDYQSSGHYTLEYEALSAPVAGAPVSSVGALPAKSPATFPVRWSGDDGGGAGIAYFDIYVSVDGGPFQAWLSRTTLMGSVYQGALGHTYAFYSVATDMAGTRETASGGAQASTTVSYQSAGPVIAPIQDQSTYTGTPLRGVPVRFFDLAAPGATLTVSADSSNPALLPPGSLVVTGHGATTGLDITPAPGLSGSAVVTVTVSDGANAASTQFTLRVNRPLLPPTAGPATFAYHSFQTLELTFADLLANATDPNGLPLTLASVSPTSTNGAGIVLARAPGTSSRGSVTYRPANASPVADQFTYTVSNGALTATGVVNLAPTPLTPPPENEMSATLNVDGTLHLEFLGAPGHLYDIQFSDRLIGGGWQTLGTKTADVSGLIRFDQVRGAGTPVGFYRAADHAP